MVAFHLKSFASLTYFAKYTNSGRTGMHAIVSDCTRERSKNKFPQFGKDAKTTLENNGNYRKHNLKMLPHV